MSGGRVRRVVLAAIRVAVGIFFVAAGVQKVLDHDDYVVRFDRWGLPAPSTAAYVAAGIEIVAGLILLLGLATRFAALVLLIEMLVLAATGGRVDGGAELVTAGVLAFFCLILVARGGGGWQLLDVIDPPRGPRPLGPSRQ
jgi:putative oxidoreductase